MHIINGVVSRSGINIKKIYSIRHNGRQSRKPPVEFSRSNDTKDVKTRGDSCGGGEQEDGHSSKLVEGAGGDS